MFEWTTHVVCMLPKHTHIYIIILHIIESVHSINRDERGFPLTQYITNGGISRARYTNYQAF